MAATTLSSISCLSSRLSICIQAVGPTENLILSVQSQSAWMDSLEGKENDTLNIKGITEKADVIHDVNKELSDIERILGDQIYLQAAINDLQTVQRSLSILDYQCDSTTNQDLDRLEGEVRTLSLLRDQETESLEVLLRTYEKLVFLMSQKTMEWNTKLSD